MIFSLMNYFFSNYQGRDVSKLLSLFKQMKGKQQLSENPPKNKIVTLPKSKGVQQTGSLILFKFEIAKKLELLCMLSFFNCQNIKIIF